MKRSGTVANKQKEDKDAKYYWVPDVKEVWLPGMLMEDKGQRIRVLIGSERTLDVEKAKCREIADRSVIFETTDDLISLGEVNDSAILNSTRLRFSQKNIYTSIGSVLMAVNPFARIDGLYSEFKIVEYENPREGDKSAHVYLIPARAYDSMKIFGKNQSILISGESGAGKTEATKQCLAFITKVAGASGSSDGRSQQEGTGRRASLLEKRASVARRMSQLDKTLDHTNVDMTVTKEKAKADIAQRVIAASPILEAFGNAQTIRNPNSSRFGKWMELSFDDRNQITGSKITSYLLEKSRVTGRDPLERNYHVFYQVIRGGSDALLDALSLRRESTHYGFLANPDGQVAKNFKDEENYAEMMEAFDLMGFPVEESEGLLRIVAAVLHLGNITFDPIDDGEASAVSGSADALHGLTHSARLLGVPNFNDLGKVLCVRTITTGPKKSITEVRLTPQKALDTRDSLAKTLFDRVFKEIIVRINAYSKSGPSSKCIGLLDIFGFEIFKNNSFEQLCINYCNEMLQNHFNLVIFINEKNMYAAENITCDTIEFKDNHLVITSIEGCFKSLDEEAKIPKGSSQTWYDKMKRKMAPGPGGADAAQSVLTFPTTAKDSFVVSHYAGPVSYLPDNFMEKNIDTLNSDLLTLMNESSVRDVKILFEDQEVISSSTAGGKKPALRSIAWHFQAQLSSLMSMLGSTESHFIRCVKSNDACKPLVFDSELVHRQLVYSGVFEVVKIQQSGLPFRFLHNEFYERYSAVLPLRVRWLCIQDPKKVLEVIRSLPQCQNRLTHMQIGRTMTFMNSKEYRLLESLKDEIEAEASTSLQLWVKTQCLRKHFALYKRLQNEGTAHLAARRIEAAESSIAELRLNAQRVAPLYALDVVYYEPFFTELERLKERTVKQLKIVTELSKVSAKPEESLTLQDLDTAARLVSDAREMEDFDDTSIDVCEEIVVSFNMADKAAKSMVSVKDLSTADIAQTVAALTRFKHVLPVEATAVISQANVYIDSIQAELEHYVPRISSALLMNALKLNKITGKLDGDTSTAALEEALQGINEADLVSFECKRMVSLCYLCIQLRRMVSAAADDALLTALKKEHTEGGLLALSTSSSSISKKTSVVECAESAFGSPGKGSKALRRQSQQRQESVMQLKRSASISDVAVATEETIAFIQKQSALLYAWATEKSLYTKLLSAITAQDDPLNERISDNALAALKMSFDEANEFAKGEGGVFSAASPDGTQCSDHFLVLVALAKELLKLRTASHNNESTLVVSTLKAFGLVEELYDIRSDIFYDTIADYKAAICSALGSNALLSADPSFAGIVEVDVYLSIYRVKYHRILQALRIICQKTPFSEANIESGNYSNVYQGSNEDNEIVKIAQSFIQQKCHVSSISARFTSGQQIGKEEFGIIMDFACKLMALRYLVSAIATGSSISPTYIVLQSAGIGISEETLLAEGSALKYGLDLLKSLGSHPGLRYIQFPMFDRELSAAKLILHIVESEAELERCLFELSVQPVIRDKSSNANFIHVSIDPAAVKQLEIVITKMNALPKCPLSLAGNVDFAVNLLDARCKIDHLIQIGHHRVEGTQTLEDCVDFWNEACDLIDELYVQLDTLCVAEKYSPFIKSGRSRNAPTFIAGEINGGSAELAVINEEFCRQRFNSGLHLILSTQAVMGSVGSIQTQSDRSMDFFRALCSEMDDNDSTFYAPIQHLKSPFGVAKKNTTAAIFGLESPAGVGDEHMTSSVYLGFNTPLRKFVELVINIRQSIVKDDWTLVIKFMHEIMQLEGIISVAKKRDMFQKKQKSKESEKSVVTDAWTEEDRLLVAALKEVPLMYVEAVAGELSLIHREGKHRNSIKQLANAIENLEVKIDPSTDRLVPDPHFTLVTKLSDALAYSAQQGQHNDDAKVLFMHANLVKDTLILVREGQVQQIVRADLDAVISYCKKRHVIRGVTMTMRHLTIVLRFVRLHQIILKLFQATAACCVSSPIPEPQLNDTAESGHGNTLPKRARDRNRSKIDSRALSVAVLRAKAENTVSACPADVLSRASATINPARSNGGPPHKSSLVAMGFQGDPDLDIWILATDTLRRLRVALSNENWKDALNVVMALRGIVTGGELEALDSQQNEFKNLLLKEVTLGYRCAMVHYLNVRMDIVKSLGPVGSRGGTSYCIPTQSVDILNAFLQELDEFEQIPEVTEVKAKISYLHLFRQAVFEESRVTDAPESRKTSVLSGEDNVTDSFAAVEKSKNPFLPYVDPEPVKVSRNKPASSSAAQRKLSLSSAKSKTAAVLANEEMGSAVDHLCGGEYKFVKKTSSLVSMIEKLELFAPMHVVTWTADSKCIFNSETLCLQTKAIQELSTSFPGNVEDIPLIKVLNELSNLALVAQREHYDPTELDTALQLFSSLIQVVDISKKIKAEMMVQVEVLQRYHLLSQFNSIHEEAVRLFERRVFERKYFDDFLTKLDPLVRAAGGEECIPADKLVVIDCVRLARELCWVTELHMLAGRANKIEAFNNLLDRSPEFKDRVGNWVKCLLSPKRCVALSVASDKPGDSELPEYVVSDENEVAVLAAEKAEEELKAAEKTNRLHAKVNEVPPLEVYRVDRVVTSVVAFRASDDPLYSEKHAAMIAWQRRANLLNASWRAIFSTTEEWAVQNMHALLVRHSPCVQVDGFAIRDMVDRIRKHLKEEVHPVMHKLIGCLADTLLETENWCAVIRTALVLDDPGSSANEGIVLNGLELVRCMDICIFYFEQLQQLLNMLRSFLFKSRQGVCLENKYWLMACEIRSIDKVAYSMQDVDTSMFIRMEGSIELMLALSRVENSLPTLCDAIAVHSVPSKGLQRQSSMKQAGSDSTCFIKDGGKDYEVCLSLLEQRVLVLPSIIVDEEEADVLNSIESNERTKLKLSIYSCKYMGAIGHKDDGTVRVHVEYLKVDSDSKLPSNSSTSELVISFNVFDKQLNAERRKKNFQSAVEYIYSRFSILEFGQPSKEKVVNATYRTEGSFRTLSMQLLKRDETSNHGKTINKLLFDNTAYAMLSKREEIQKIGQFFDGCFLDHRTAGETQEILNDRNSGNANISLKDLLKAAKINVDMLIILLRERCYLTCTSHIGFQLSEFTPWSVSWLRLAEMEEAAVLSQRFPQVKGGFSALLMAAMMRNWKLIHNGTAALMKASQASIADFAALIPELAAVTEHIKATNFGAIAHVDDNVMSTAPWWEPVKVEAWLASQQLALDVIVRSIDSLRLMREMELNVVQFKEYFLYSAEPASRSRIYCSRRSIRHSFSQNSSRRSLTMGIEAGSPSGKSSLVDSKVSAISSSSPMKVVALALEAFVARLLAQNTACDDTAIPKGCFDLLFYAKLFLPSESADRTNFPWHRHLAHRASTFMSTRLLFRPVEHEKDCIRSMGRRESSISNSRIDELQIMANLETYRRAMILSIHLQKELINRSVKQVDVLSSFHSESNRVSPAAFIHMLLYVLRADQLPPYMQPQFALSPNAHPFNKSEETDTIIESLHDLVEAVTSFQTLRKTGIEKYYNVGIRTDIPAFIQLNSDFEIALKVTVLRQQDAIMRPYLYREVLTSLDSGMLFIPRRSIQGIVEAARTHGCYLPGLFGDLCKVMSTLRVSIFNDELPLETDLCTTVVDTAEVQTEDTVISAGGAVDNSKGIIRDSSLVNHLHVYQREIRLLDDELNVILASEIDSNEFCQLVCLRAIRNLCRLVHQVLFRPRESTVSITGDALTNIKASWRHCVDDIINDLTLGQCLGGRPDTSGNRVEALSNEFLIRQLLFNIQSVGWISDRMNRIAECVNDSAFSVMSLCAECFEIDTTAEESFCDTTSVVLNEKTDEDKVDVSLAWRWYTLIPRNITGSSNTGDENYSPHRSRHSIELNAVKQCYLEFKDLCFKYTALVYRDTDSEENPQSTDTFISLACKQLQNLSEFCSKWAVTPVADIADDNMPHSGAETKNLFEYLMNMYQASLAAANERNRLQARMRAGVVNLDAGITGIAIIGDDDDDLRVEYKVEDAENTSLDPDRFLLNWAVDSVAMGQALHNMSAHLKDAMSSRFCDDVTAKLQDALNKWEAADYVDSDHKLKPRHQQMEQSIHALLDVLKYTIAAVQTDKNPTALVDGGALYMRHMSVQENVNSNRSMHPVNTVPYYLTPATHQKCLQSRDISHLTRKAIIVLGVREAASAGRWFAESPMLDHANLGAAKSRIDDDGDAVDQSGELCTSINELSAGDKETVEYWLYQWFGMRWLSEINFHGEVNNIANSVIGDAEINFVVTLLENACLSRQLTQLKDFLFSLHSGELSNLFSTCSFHVRDPWGSAESATTEDGVQVKPSMAKNLDKDRLHNDENRFALFEYAKYVLSRAFTIRPYPFMTEDTRSGVMNSEVLYDMLICSDVHAVWALQSLQQKPMSVTSTLDASLIEITSEWQDTPSDAIDFDQQVEMSVGAARHELSVQVALDLVLKDIHLRHLREVYQFTADGHPSHDINDSNYNNMISIHITEFNNVEIYVHTIIEQLTRESAREDLQIKIALLGQYVDFWKCRFNCQQDVSHSGIARVQRRRSSHDTTGTTALVLHGAEAAHERMRSIPLTMVKDWLEVSRTGFDALFDSSLAELAYLRADISAERRRAVNGSLGVLYQAAIDTYQPYRYDDFGGSSGPRIVSTILKGKTCCCDRNIPVDVELMAWLSRVNEETNCELFIHLRQFQQAIVGIRSALAEVKVCDNLDQNTTSTAIAMDSNTGNDAAAQVQFAYDNLVGVLELSPLMREAGVVEKLISWLCEMPEEDLRMVVDAACGEEANSPVVDETSKYTNPGKTYEADNWAVVQSRGANEYDNMLMDKTCAALQCPLLPMPLYIGLLNWRDSLVTHIIESRIRDAIQSSVAVSVSAAACNGRKHIFLTLADEFLKLSMLLVEKDYLLGQRALRREDRPSEHGRTLETKDNQLPSGALLRTSLFILSVLMAVLEEDWEKIDVLSKEANGQLLALSPDGSVESPQKTRDRPMPPPPKRRPSVSVFQSTAPPPRPRNEVPKVAVDNEIKEVHEAVTSINTAVQHLFVTAKRIKLHNHIMEMIEEQISYDLSRTFQGSGGRGSSENDIRRSRSGSAGGEDDPVSASALHGYFQFIDFVQLQEALALYEEKEHINSEELQAFVALCQFLIRLRLAIIANKWFDETLAVAGLEIPEGFSDSDDKEDDDHFDDQMTSLGNVDASIGSAELSQLLQDARLTVTSPSMAEHSPTRRPLSSPAFPSVSYLLLNEKPDYLPRHIAAEVQRVDKEFQNHQVEMRLIQALLSDQDYLETGDYQSITTKHLEKVLLMSSIVRQRSIRTSQLYESAQKILSLRNSIKSADWSGIRCWLIELRDLAPEAEKEVSAVCAMSEANLAMHVSLTQAMSQHRISGTYARLDISQTNIVLLLSALRAAESVPKLSADDRQIIYSAEKLKTVRLCILMADYTKLLREIEDIELRELADVAQDELFLVKRAIGFYTTLKNISNCLKTGHIVAAAGYAESQDVSLYVLNNAISSIEISDCSGSIEFYLQNAILIRDLRAAIKAGKWGALELAELLLRSVRKNKETYELKRKFSKYYTHHGDNSVIYYADRDSVQKRQHKISSLKPFQQDEPDLYPSFDRLRSNSSVSHASREDNEDVDSVLSDDPELQDEKSFHIATSMINHCAHSLLNVDYGKIIFGRDEGENIPSPGCNSGSDMMYMSPRTTGGKLTTFTPRNGSSENLFRRQYSSNVSASGGDVSGKCSSRSSPIKQKRNISPDNMNIHRRSSGITASFYKSSPRKASQSFSGIEFDASVNVNSTNLFPSSGRTLGNEIANEESGYCDIPQETLYLTSALRDPSLDKTCVAALLGRSMPSTVLVEVEAEITQIRDELYHRVSSAILQKCFYTQQQLNNIAKGGTVATASVAIAPRGKAFNDDTDDIDDDETTRLSGVEASGLASSGYVIDIDDAIHCARHLGVKSDSCRRLYLTALLVRDLRRSVKEVTTTGNRKSALDVFVRAQSLKTNDMFDSVAAAELEQAFLAVCGGSMKGELLGALRALVNAPTSVQDTGSRGKVFKGATPEVVGRLKTAVRNARHVSLLAQDPETRALTLASEAMLALHAAVKVGVLSKMQVCYDIAVQVTSSAELEDDDSFSLRKKIVQELAGVRRYMLSIQMTTPLLSNKAQGGPRLSLSPKGPGTPIRVPTSLFSFTHQPSLMGSESKDGLNVNPGGKSVSGAHSTDRDALSSLGALLEFAVAAKLSSLSTLAAATDNPTNVDGTEDSASHPSVATATAMKYIKGVSIVVKRDGELKGLLEVVVENRTDSFSLLQRVVASVLLSLLGITAPSAKSGLYENVVTITPVDAAPSRSSPKKKKLGSPISSKRGKLVAPSENNPTLEHLSSAEHTHSVFLPGSSGRWLHEDAALNGDIPVLIGGDGRKGPYSSPVVHIPVEIIQLAIQLLGTTGKSATVVPTSEHTGVTACRGTAKKRFTRAAHGTGLTLFGEFVQMVVTMTESRVPSNFMIILRAHTLFYSRKLEEHQCSMSTDTLTSSCLRPKIAHLERILSFLSTQMAGRVAEQIKVLRTPTTPLDINAHGAHKPNTGHSNHRENK